MDGVSVAVSGLGQQALGPFGIEFPGPIGGQTALIRAAPIFEGQRVSEAQHNVSTIVWRSMAIERANLTFLAVSHSAELGSLLAETHGSSGL